MDLELVLKDLNQVVDFLLPHLEMANLNNSDFIIDNHWNMLSEKIAEELLQLDGATIAELPSGKVGKHFTSTKVPSCDYNVTLTPLQSFIQNCYLNTLPNLASLSTPDILKHQMGIKFPCLQGPAINSFMSQKKQYEVGHLASLSDEIFMLKVVDIGSGLGYLGGYMSLMFGYDVLALDSVKDRTDTAEKRTKLLKKQWISLIQNALNDKNTDGLSSTELGNYKRNLVNSSFTPMCLYITSGDQLDGLCKEHFGAEHPLLFTALHACGDLTPSILKLFVKSSLASAICLVGCCYNLINEEFLSGNENSGFPMSSHLKKKSFALGINARSLASQSPDRLSHSKKVVMMPQQFRKQNSFKTLLHLKQTPSESLFWRALLQVMLVDKFGRPKMKNQWRVGKVASKCNSFQEYVSLSLKKLGLEMQITEEETSSYLEKYKDFRWKCLLFHQLRVSLGLCVESLIHLDRLSFLLEQDSVETAHLVRLFDPVQSPRCYAVIAIKR